MSNLCVAGYAGSKNKIAEAYLPYILYNGITTYVEPFGGMFGVGLNKSPHHIEIYNDLNKKLALLFSVLSDGILGIELISKMCTVPYSKEFFDKAKKTLQKIDFNKNSFDRVEIACYVWSMLLMSFNGQMETFRGVYTGAEEEQLHMRMIKKYLLAERLQGLTVLNKDGLEVIEEYKNDRHAFLFLDPPYTQVNETSNNRRQKIYEHEILADKDQLNFLTVLEAAKARILVCSYKNTLYDKMLCTEYGWKCYPVADTVKSMRIGGVGENRSRATEFVYVNYEIEKCQ